MSQGQKNSMITTGVDNMVPKIDKSLIEGLPVAIYTCDREGKITFFNKAAEILWGRKPDIGQDLWSGSWKIFNTDGTPMDHCNCPMAIALKEGREVNNHEIIFERPDGSRVHVLPHPKPIFDERGILSGAINMVVDVTGKHEAERLIRESENKYRQLSESLETTVADRTMNLRISEERYHKMIDEVQDYAILLLDKDGTVMNWNKGAEKIKGYHESEIVGKNFRLFYLDEDRNDKLPEKLIRQAIDHGKAMHEGWRLRKDGTKFWGSIVITALHDNDNNIMGFSKVTRDLTEKKLADDQIRQYSKDLEFQNRELAQYAHVASHDLQEPLRKIQTFANLLERNLDDKAALQKYIDKIIASARRMEGLIKDVLKYSKLSYSDDVLTATDLNKVLENVKEDFDLLIEQKKVKINHSVLPVVDGIPIQLYQLFSNLISNAIKFSHQEPRIEISSEHIMNGDLHAYPHLNSQRKYVKITFKDNGIGFEQEYAEQAFRLFQRLSDNKLGTGIGLALCKKIVENHKGHISVESAPSKGTTFNILLPV